MPFTRHPSSLSPKWNLYCLVDTETGRSFIGYGYDMIDPDKMKEKRRHGKPYLLGLSNDLSGCGRNV